MSAWALFALVVTVTGIYAVRWTRRLARRSSELPVKTMAATVTAAALVAADIVGAAPAEPIVPLLAVLAAVYVFAPLVITALGRQGRFSPAAALVSALYWTPTGREGVQRLLVQVALRRGALAAAERLMPRDAPLLRLQWLAASERWSEVLADHGDGVAGPAGGETPDNAWLVAEARVRALLALDRLPEAEAATERLARAAERDDAGPILSRVARLAAARLAAARGRLDEAQRELDPAPAGVAAHELFAILALAAERGGHDAAAGELWTRAYAAAPEPLRPRYEHHIVASGREVPIVVRRQPLGTWALTAGLAAMYLGQTILDGVAQPVATALGRLDPSQAASALLLNVPGVPEGDAWWRLFSYAFVHGNLLHIGLNAWVLFDVGRLYESRRSWGDLVSAFVFGTAMGGYLTTVAQSGDVVVLVGASGGVLGVAGALLADVLRGRGAADRSLTRSLVQWMGLIALLSVAVPGVSLWGHVGGVIGGLLWGFARQGLPAGPRTSQLAGGAGLALLAVAAVATGNAALRLL